MGGSVGGLLSASGQLRVCQTHPWGIEHLCSTWATPGAFWRGGIAGLWVGTILGAVAAGRATYKPDAASQGTQEDGDGEIPWCEIQAWIESASRLEPQALQSLNAEQTRELLKQLGFSEGAIEKARLPKLEKGESEPLDRHPVETLEKWSGESYH